MAERDDNELVANTESCAEDRDVLREAEDISMDELPAGLCSVMNSRGYDVSPARTAA